MSGVADQLTALRGLALDGDRASALKQLDDLVRQEPLNVEALRLKGNILEWGAYERALHSPAKLLRSRGFLEARKCYEQILSLDPENTLAHIDLADHFRNLGANQKALEFYERAMKLLATGVYRWSRKDEAEEAFSRASDLYQEIGCEAESQRVLDAWRVLRGRLRVPRRSKVEASRAPVGRKRKKARTR
jgi:tetratricopeptide (TPR) repeat protein